MRNRSQVKVVVGAVRDPARFLDWADIVLLVSKNKTGEATLESKRMYETTSQKALKKVNKTISDIYALPVLFTSLLLCVSQLKVYPILKVYSITSEESLAEAKLAAERLTDFTKIYNRSVIVVGNKTDLEIYRFHKTNEMNRIE